MTISSIQGVKCHVLAVLLAGTVCVSAQTTTTTNFTVGTAIPDGATVGVASFKTVTTSISSITGLKVNLKLTGTFNGDFYCYLAHNSGFSVLLNRPGRRVGSNFGYGDPGVDLTFDDAAANGDVHVYRLTLNGSHSTPLSGPLTGTWKPDGRASNPTTVLDSDVPSALLNSFNGMDPNGDWVLFVADLATGDMHTLESWGLIITGNEAQAPGITAQPANQSAECSSGSATFSVTASGVPPLTYQWRFGGTAISGATSSSYTLNNPTPGAAGGYDVVVSSSSGSVTSLLATLTIVDTTPPSITCPVVVTVSCASQVPAANIGSVIASDSCGAVTVAFVSDVISAQTCANRYTITRTYQATDSSANVATCTQLITVNDQTAPSISCPAAVSVSCASQVPAADIGSVTTSDGCGGAVTVTHEGDAISAQTCANRYIVMRTYKATDVCGNSATCTQVITVNDQTAPSISCPAAVSVSCPSQVPAVDIAGVTSSDGCGGAVTVTHEGDVVSAQTCANRYTLTRTYKATDACGNSATCTQVITVNDQTAPSISCPAAVSVGCPSQVPAVDIAGVTSSDGCGGAVTVTHEGDVISAQTCANRYIVTRTYKATDACGNSATCTQVITVNDQTAPTLSCPAAVTVSCVGQVPAVDIASVTTSDGCGGVVTVTHEGDVVSAQTCANRFIVTRTYKATDACGNSVTCTQVITVNDQTAPTLSCPAAVTVSCAGQVPAVAIGGVTTSDGCGGVVTVTHEGDVVSAQTCANRFIVTRTYKATDACGNSATCTQVITVNDQTAPTLSCPAAVSVSCPSQVPAVNIAGVTTSDGCGGVVTVTYEGDVISAQTCANRYTVARTYKATDACGNSATCTQVITVNDQTAPTLSCPAAVSVSCPSQVPAVAIGGVTASDGCGGVVTVTYEGDVISAQTCANRYTVARTYKATDACGNSATCTQVITVNDQTAPTLSCPAAVSVSCPSQVPAVAIGGVTASDGCGGAVTVTHEGDVISAQTCANRYTVARTYKATDACGNSATCTQVITVNDQTAPTLSCPAAVTVSCASQVPAVAIGGVTASDGCGGAVTVTHEGDVISAQTCANRYTVTRTYKATDACGNSATCTQVITVNDQTAPTLSCPAAVTVSCVGQVPAVDIAGVTTSDGCGGAVTVTHEGDVVSSQICANRYTITRTYKATDACGNSATCTQVITVNDQTAPTLSCPAAVTVSCAGDVPAVNIAGVTASDGCGGAVTVMHVGETISAQTCANRFTVTRTYRATDACGNSATCTQVITVNDQTAPTLSCPAAVTVSCVGQVPAVAIGGVTASDGCGGVVTVTHEGDVISSQTCANRYTITRTYKATDVCGNSATCTQVITVNDQTAPTLSCPAAVTVSCSSQVPAANIASVTASDGCGGAVTVTHMGDVISGQTCVNRYTVTRTYKATDVCGNFTTCTQVITVNDQTPPTFTCAPAKNVECGGTWVFDPPTLVADACGSSLAVVLSTTTNTVGHLGTTYDATRVWRVTDACGNFADCSQVVTVIDTLAPFIVCSPNLSVSTMNPAGAAMSFSVPAADICSGVVEAVCVPPSGTIFQVGVRTVNCTATDANNNSANCSFTVTVLLNHNPVGVDNIMGVLQNHPRAIAIEKLLLNDTDPDGDTLTLTGVSATSTNGAAVTRTSTEVLYAPVANFIGTDLFTYTLSDGRGGTATASVIVHVLSMNDPSLNLIGGVTVTTNGVKIQFAGIPGFVYSVERSTNLSNWAPIGNFTVPDAGIAEYQDTQPPAGAAFYRTVMVE